MTPTIEASDKSLKLSYLRFVSDSAPGLLLVLFLILAGERHLNLPDDAALKALFAIVAFLLATPLGLLINGMSHFLLGGIQHGIAARCFTNDVWPIASTHRILLVSKWRAYFDVKQNAWPDIAYEVDDLFDTFMPHLAAALDHVRALKKFCRSVALLALVAIFVAAGRDGAIAAAVLVILLLLGFLLSARSYRVVMVLGIISAAGIAIYGCWPDFLGVGSILFAVGITAIMFAGFVEFYQYAYLMLLLYQLLMRTGETTMPMNAESVRERLREAVRQLPAGNQGK